MSQKLWSAVEGYLDAHVLPSESLLDEVLAASRAAGLPDASISASQGKLLALLVRLSGARSVLELGTLGGYSTIWLGRPLPVGGRLVSLERDAGYAEIARSNVARAGLAGVVEVRVGNALQTLSELVAEGAGPFDLIFIDADKRNNPSYLEWSLELSRPGTVIVADNVVRAGAILDQDASDPPLGAGGLQGLRSFYELLGGDPRVSATVIQTVGAKGYDGFALALVRPATLEDGPDGPR